VGRPPAHHERSLKVISSKRGPPVTVAQLAAFEFPAINEIAAMPKKDRQQRAHELATQVHIAAIAGLELLSMDKAKLIARVQNRYEFFGPRLMELADARQSAEALCKAIGAAEKMRLAVALAVVEGGDDDPDGREAA
jgi:hypothetical protein